MIWLTIMLLWIGAAFMLIAAIGIARLPDTFTRLQAATKAVTLGMASMMLAAATHFADVGVTVRALTTLLFLFATAPVAAHLIGRVAYLVGGEMWEGTQFDELRDKHAARRPDGERQPPPGAWDDTDQAMRRRSG
jgi:multicomponent Na+:H+ antiporter subunit G